MVKSGKNLNSEKLKRELKNVIWKIKSRTKEQFLQRAAVALNIANPSKT